MQETPVWFLGQEDLLEKGYATHSSILGFPLWLSWRSRLQCGKSGFDPWVGKIPWRRERLSTPVFWPGEFHELYSPWGHKEGMTEVWDGWMASLTQWTWVWASSRSWWWTGKPGRLQSMGSQRVRHDWETELNWRSWRWSPHERKDCSYKGDSTEFPWTPSTIWGHNNK